MTLIPAAVKAAVRGFLRRTPVAYNVYELVEDVRHNNPNSHWNSVATSVTTPDGREAWVPVRAEPYNRFSDRVTLAWKVFCGHADVITWPQQET